MPKLDDTTETFLQLYLAGPDGTVGNATEAYMQASAGTLSRPAAATRASRALARGSVRTRMGELRDLAQGLKIARLREWVSMAPAAQHQLYLISEGKTPADWTDEQVRSALKACAIILDRAIGTVKQQVEHSGGVALVAQVLHVPGSIVAAHLEASNSKPPVPSVSEAALGRLLNPGDEPAEEAGAEASPPGNPRC